MKLELHTLKVNDIKPYEKNARKNKEAVKAVKKSIKANEYISPIIVDENNVILAGHTRYMALKELGEKEIQCVVKKGLTEAQKKAYRIADNKTGEIAEWDFGLLPEEIESIANLGYDITDLGFSDDELEAIINDGLNAAEEVQQVYAPKTVQPPQPQYYEEEEEETEYNAPTFNKPAPTDLLQDMMTTEFVDLTPKEQFSITFTFDSEYKEAVFGYIKDHGKAAIVEIILNEVSR